MAKNRTSGRALKATRIEMRGRSSSPTLKVTAPDQLKSTRIELKNNKKK